jgi:hypothetical protein
MKRWFAESIYNDKISPKTLVVNFNENVEYEKYYFTIKVTDFENNAVNQPKTEVVYIFENCHNDANQPFELKF